MIDLKAINLNFSIKVTESNISIVKRLFRDTNLVDVESEDQIGIGEEIDLNFCFEGGLGDDIVSMAMLFNSDLAGKPKITLLRE